DRVADRRCIASKQRHWARGLIKCLPLARQLTRSYLSRGLSLVCAFSLGVLAADRTFISYGSAKSLLEAQALEAQKVPLPPELKNLTEAKWNGWAQAQDKAIRARLQQGDLDSMVNLLLYGTSFTKQPRIKVEGLTEASKAGILRARVDDLVA